MVNVADENIKSLSIQEMRRIISSIKDLSILNCSVDGMTCVMHRTMNGIILDVARLPEKEKLFGGDYRLVKVFLDGNLNVTTIYDVSTGRPNQLKKETLEIEVDDIIEKIIQNGNYDREAQVSKETFTKNDVAKFIKELETQWGPVGLIHFVTDDKTWDSLGNIEKFRNFIHQKKFRKNVIDILLKNPKYSIRAALLQETSAKLQNPSLAPSIPDEPVSHTRAITRDSALTSTIDQSNSSGEHD